MTLFTLAIGFIGAAYFMAFCWAIKQWRDVMSAIFGVTVLLLAAFVIVAPPVTTYMYYAHSQQLFVCYEYYKTQLETVFPFFKQ